jgi:hypothetical protein
MMTDKTEKTEAEKTAEIITTAFIDAITSVVEDDKLGEAIAKQAAVNMLKSALVEMQEEIDAARGTKSAKPGDYVGKEPGNVDGKILRPDFWGGSNWYDKR